MSVRRELVVLPGLARVVGAGERFRQPDWLVGMLLLLLCQGSVRGMGRERARGFEESCFVKCFYDFLVKIPLFHQTL